MIVKHCLKDKFYLFNPKYFSFIKIREHGNYEGKLFKVGQSKVILWPQNNSLFLKTKEIMIDVNNCSFTYYETNFFCYLSIDCEQEKITLKCLKSVWELANISTYDYLEKIEDNNLYYLYDVIKEFKSLKTSSEVERFILEF